MSLFKVPKMVLQKLETIRCRFFHRIENNKRKPIWVTWSEVLASKEKGGLGVSNFFALNRALMFKWVWRFRSQNDSLWARVIKGIHGDDGKLGATATHYHPSIWLDIIREVKSLKHQGMDLVGCIRKKVGIGNETLGGTEQSQLNALMLNIDVVSLADMSDRWVWTMEGSGGGLWTMDGFWLSFLLLQVR
ncbi:hypothetical protein Tco_0886469 [Tanacetum coccineum]